MKLEQKLQQPVGLTYDVLHELRKAKRALVRAEQWIMREHKAEKKRRAASKGTGYEQWEMAKHIRDEERMREANEAAQLARSEA